MPSQPHPGPISAPAKLVSADIALIGLLWVAAVYSSGNRIGFVLGSLPILFYVCAAVAWRVYVRVSRAFCLRLRDAVIDGALAGALLSVFTTALLLRQYAFAAGVWWDGSDGSDPSDWRLWASHLIASVAITTAAGALAGIFVWCFNVCLLLYPLRRTNVEAGL